MTQYKSMQRPDWEYVYRISSHEADRDDELVTITRETARLAENALRKMNGEDFYDNSGAAERELMDVLAEEELMTQITTEMLDKDALKKASKWPSGSGLVVGEIVADYLNAMVRFGKAKHGLAEEENEGWNVYVEVPSESMDGFPVLIIRLDNPVGEKS